jgi:hypothetical protein
MHRSIEIKRAGLRNQRVLEFLESPTPVFGAEQHLRTRCASNGRRGQSEVTVHVFGKAPTGTRRQLVSVVRIGFQSCGAVPSGGLSGGVN